VFKEVTGGTARQGCALTAARYVLAGSHLFRRLGARRVPALAGVLCAGFSLRGTERHLGVAW